MGTQTAYLAEDSSPRWPCLMGVRVIPCLHRHSLERVRGAPASDVASLPEADGRDKRGSRPPLWTVRAGGLEGKPPT